MPITPIPDYTCLTDEQVHELQAECQVLIAAVSERIHYAESRRGMLATIGAALVAARVATVAGAISILDKAEWWIACAVTGLCLTMTGLSIWFLYSTPNKPISVDRGNDDLEMVLSRRPSGFQCLEVWCDQLLLGLANNQV